MSRRVDRTARWLALVAAASLAATACASGESIINAGNEPTTTVTVPPPVTAPPGETLPPTTSTLPPTTTTTPLDALAPCPVEALDDAGGPVEITLWFGLGAEVEAVLQGLVADYNASQDAVRVVAQNQTSYENVITAYAQSGVGARGDVVLLPEYVLQQIADTGEAVPVDACMEADDFDTSAFLDRPLEAYATGGVQWAMPFNVSNPVLYYNRNAFEAAGLDPDDPPETLEELRATSQALVDSGAVTYGIAFDSGADSGGGWFLEQWLGKAGALYSDNGNGRVAPSTQVLFNGPVGVELLESVQSMIDDGIAMTVGNNANTGFDQLLKLADAAEPAGMAIATSAALSTVQAVLGGGMIPGFEPGDLGVGVLPGPTEVPGALVGGASLYITADGNDEQVAASWDFVQYLISAQSQSTWAAGTGYVPIREDALALDPIASLYRDDPRYRVAYDQLVADVPEGQGQGPVLGPLREIRAVVANSMAAIFAGSDVQQALDAAAAQSNSLIQNYAATRGG
jgi:sn-glycerol 3-phosphate transport system substrate-binding protein